MKLATFQITVSVRDGDVPDRLDDPRWERIRHCIDTLHERMRQANHVIPCDWEYEVLTDWGEPGICRTFIPAGAMVAETIRPDFDLAFTVGNFLMKTVEEGPGSVTRDDLFPLRDAYRRAVAILRDPKPSDPQPPPWDLVVTTGDFIDRARKVGIGKLIPEDFQLLIDAHAVATGPRGYVGTPEPPGPIPAEPTRADVTASEHSGCPNTREPS